MIDFHAVRVREAGKRQHVAGAADGAGQQGGEEGEVEGKAFGFFGNDLYAPGSDEVGDGLEGVVGDANGQGDFGGGQVPADADGTEEGLAGAAEEVEVFHQREVGDGNGDGGSEVFFVAAALDMARSEVDESGVGDEFEDEKEAVCRDQQIAGGKQQAVLHDDAFALCPVQREEKQEGRDEFGGEVIHGGIIAERRNINNL